MTTLQTIRQPVPGRATSAIAPNYHPLPVVIAQGHGAWVSDTDGRHYLDCLAGYSALNFGHGHPHLLEAAHRQLDRVTLTSRAFLHDQLEEFCSGVATLARRVDPAMDMVLPMNTGAEAVETAIKLVRRWGHRVRGVPQGEATIVVAADNFHGRTTTIVSFSTDPSARDGFGPFTPGFRVVPYGDAAALAGAIDETTVAILLEPVQGEAGVILGKALGGGIVPVSAVVSRREVLSVMTPGSHGSTFGGNPLACAVGRAVVELLETGEFQRRAAVLGARLRTGLEALVGDGVSEVRSIGLWAGVDIDPGRASAREVCERLAARGILTKDTRATTVRLAPPLVIGEDEIDHLLDAFGAALSPR